jgi:SAM-dependent methyltransferase
VKIAHKDIGDLLFYWPTLTSREYYNRTVGQCHTIPALDQPRFHFIKALIEGPFEGAVQKHLEMSKLYTPNGWQPDANNAAAYGHKLLAHYEAIKENGIQGSLTLMDSLSGDGRLVLQDGNHRIIFAHFLGLDLEANVVSTREVLKRQWSRPPEKRLHLYQSVFIDGKELVPGHRRDALARMNCIRPEDIEGKSVLVLGCNSGRDCFLAGERGASRIVGVDKDAPLLNYALQEATCHGYPTDFIQVDLEEPFDIGPFDTVLAFSVYHWVANRTLLAQTMKAGKVVYFEGHVLLPLLSDEEYRARYADAIGSFHNIETVYEVDAGVRRMFRMER